MAGRLYLASGVSPTLAGATRRSGYCMPYIGIVYESD